MVRPLDRAGAGVLPSCVDRLSSTSLPALSLHALPPESQHANHLTVLPPSALPAGSDPLGRPRGPGVDYLRRDGALRRLLSTGRLAAGHRRAVRREGGPLDPPASPVRHRGRHPWACGWLLVRTEGGRASLCAAGLPVVQERES